MRSSLPLMIAVFAALAACAGELDVARDALRDGLWDVARVHAMEDGSDEARLVVLESFAREGDWPSVLKALDEWNNPGVEEFVCYRAAALVRTGEREEASKVLSSASFAEAANAKTAARLKAEIALSGGDAAEALKILDADGGDDIDTLMLRAEALEATSDEKGADEIWRKIATGDAPERTRAAAAARLGDVSVLMEVYSGIGTPDLKRFCGFHLGVAMLKDPASFDEGAKIVCKLVRDAPDADGARDVFMALAESRLDRGEWSAAAQTFAEALETWPDIAKDASFQEGRGWAFSKLGRDEDALAAFDRAAELTTNRSVKATALVKSGDALAALGRGAEAMERYRTVRREYPDTEAAVQLADLLRLQEQEDEGRSLYSEFRFADAQRVFEKIASEDASRRPRMAYYAVLCLYGQGRDDEAERRARSLADDTSIPSPLRAEAILWLAKLAYNKSRWREASQLFADYVSIAPDSSHAPLALVWSARAAFAEGDYQRAVSTVGTIAAKYPDSDVRAAGLLVQGEALIELARFDEAVLVLERAALAQGATAADRLRAQMLRADALFAMGADNQARYVAALEAYRTVVLGENLTPSERLSLSFKIGKVLERLKRADEAIDQYYTQVLVAYRSGRLKGTRYDDSAKADFSRAAFRLAEEYESRGRDKQAINILKLVSSSDVPAAAEALRRIERIKRKGKFL